MSRSRTFYPPLPPLANPGFQDNGEGGHPDPEMRKKTFPTLGPQFGIKIRGPGDPGPPAPPLYPPLPPTR